eukprot:3292-Heterococcus_DN1.PRE.1
MRHLHLVVAVLACAHVVTAFVCPLAVSKATQQLSHVSARSVSSSKIAPVATCKHASRCAPLSMTESSPYTKRAKHDLSRKLSSRGTGYFTLWFAINALYNIANKQTLQKLPLPWLISSVQLVVGSIYIGLVWALKMRPAPELNKEEFKLTVTTISNCDAFRALHAWMIGLGAGAIGFVHIVKAAEPIFTALFSALLLKQYLPLPVILSLLPVVGGVAVASIKELTFSWAAFNGAMGSNLAASTRGVLSKKLMGESMGKNMDPGNLYGVMTIIAALLSFPLALIVEGPRFSATYKAALLAGNTAASIWRGTIMSGVYFYLYNEVAFYCLNSIDAVTHAVGNTIKRIVLLAVSVVVFNHQMSPM